MRWVWRAEHGGFKVEYGALILLVATIVTAVFAFGMPTRVQEFYTAALCRVDPEREDCEPFGGGPGTGEGGEADGGQDGEGSDGDSESDGADGDGGADEDGEEDAGEEQEGDDFDSDAYDALLEAENAVYDAEDELAKAEGELENSDYDEVYDALIEVVADIVGWTDAKKCITEGDIIACLTTIVGLSPWGKGLKLIKNTGKIIKLWNRFRKAKKARDAAKKLVDKARGKVKDKKKTRDDAVKECTKGGKRGAVFADPVALDDGTLLYVEDLDPVGTDYAPEPALQSAAAGAPLPSGTVGRVAAPADTPGDKKGDACERPPDDPATKKVDGLKDEISQKFPDATVKPAKTGWVIKVPYGKNKDITIRVMQGSKGNAREGETYYRVSVGNKGAVDKNGNPTSDRGASHIDLDDNSLSDIENIVNKYKK